jgi:hypothetical protein
MRFVAIIVEWLSAVGASLACFLLGAILDPGTLPLDNRIVGLWWLWMVYGVFFVVAAIGVRIAVSWRGLSLNRRRRAAVAAAAVLLGVLPLNFLSLAASFVCFYTAAADSLERQPG